MNTKIVILFSILCFVTTSVIAQPRVNGKGPIKIEKVSQVITDPVGWLYDKSTRKWCGYYGLLWANYKNNDKKPVQASLANRVRIYNEPDYGKQLWEISTIQMKRTKIDTTTMYLLYISSWYVTFDYPYIREGAHYHKQYEVFLLSESSYKMLWTLDTGITKIPIIYGGGYIGNNEKNILIRLNDPKYLTYNRWEDERIWNIKKEEDGVIRFVAPVKLYGVEGDMYGNPDFQDKYFEVSANTFNRLRIQ